MGTDKKIRVCHIISGDLWAGAEVQVHTLLKTLKESSSIELYAIVMNKGRLLSELDKLGFMTTLIDENNFSFFNICRLAGAWLKDKKIDIIHAHRYKENILGAYLKKRKYTRYLVQTVHGIPEPFAGLKKIKNALTGAVNIFVTKHYFDKIIAVSADIRDSYSGKIDSVKLATIHNSVNIPNVLMAKSAAEMRREFGIKPGQRVIGTAGRMVPVKGLDIFLEASKIIIDKHPETKILLAGDGPLKQDLIRKAHQLGIYKNTMFLGFRDDILDILNGLDIFVISSYHEGIPTAVLEAMALGKVVIGTAVGGMSEIIADGVSGMLVQPANPPVLAKACLKVLADEKLAKQTGIAAVNRIKEEFSSEIQVARTIELYEGLIQRS